MSNKTKLSKEELKKIELERTNAVYKSMKEKQSLPQKTGDGINSMYGVLMRWFVRTTPHNNTIIKNTVMLVFITNVEQILKSVRASGDHAALYENSKLCIPKNQIVGSGLSKKLVPIENDKKPFLLHNGKIFTVSAPGDVEGLMSGQQIRLDSLRIEVDEKKMEYIKCNGVKHVPFDFKNVACNFDMFYSSNTALSAYKGFECLLSDHLRSKKYPDSVVLDYMNKKEHGVIFVSSKCINIINGEAIIKPFSYTTMTESEYDQYLDYIGNNSNVATSVAIGNPYTKRTKDNKDIIQFALLGKLYYERELNVDSVNQKELEDHEANEGNDLGLLDVEPSDLEEESHQLQPCVSEELTDVSDLPDLSNFDKDDYSKPKNRKGEINFKFYGVSGDTIKEGSKTACHSKSGVQDTLFITDHNDFDTIMKFNLPDFIVIPDSIETNNVSSYLGTETFETISKSTICIPNTLPYILNMGLNVPNDFILKDVAAMYNDLELINTEKPLKGSEEKLWYKTKFPENYIPGSSIRSALITTLYSTNLLNSRDYGFINAKEYDKDLEEYQLQYPTISRILFGKSGMLINQDTGKCFENKIFSYNEIAGNGDVSKEVTKLSPNDITKLSKKAYKTQKQSDIFIAQYWAKQLIRFFFLVKLSTNQKQNFPNIQNEYIQIYSDHFEQKALSEAIQISKWQKVDKIDFKQLKNELGSVFTGCGFVSYSIKNVEEPKKVHSIDQSVEQQQKKVKK